MVYAEADELGTCNETFLYLLRVFCVCESDGEKDVLYIKLIHGFVQ